MPAAAIIPVRRAYIIVVAVKKVVGVNDGSNYDSLKVAKRLAIQLVVDFCVSVSIQETEPEKRLPHRRKAAGVQITQS